MTAVRSITNILTELKGKVTLAIRFPYVVTAKPVNVFVEKNSLLRQIAERVTDVIGEAMVEIQDALIGESADFKDSVNSGIMKKLGKLQAFYQKIANSLGLLTEDSEFAGQQIKEPFETLENWANILTEQYK